MCCAGFVSLGRMAFQEGEGVGGGVFLGGGFRGGTWEFWVVGFEVHEGGRGRWGGL